MSMEHAMPAERILNEVERLPSLPRAVIEIMRTIDDPDVSAAALARQIESDIGLLSGVLRLVNSSLYAVSGHVSTAHQAVVLLGFNAIRNLVCVAGITDYFQKNSARTFDHENFLRHSAGVGCAAKLLAGPAGLNPDTAFVAGILHDLGQLALAASAPYEYNQIMDYQTQQGCSLAEAEQAVIGMDHARIGAHLAKLWHLPDEICESIEWHHQVSDHQAPVSPIADLIHVANVLAYALELGSEEPVPLLSDGALIRLGLTLQQAWPLLGRIEDEYSDYTKMLGVSESPQKS